MKDLHKFFNRVDISWVHLVWKKHYRNGKLANLIKRGLFWWRDALKLLKKYKGMATVSVLEDGKTCYVWTDLWEGQVPSQAYPELYSFAKNKSASIHAIKQLDQLEQIFNLPLLVEGHGQLNDWLNRVENVANSDGEK